MPIPAYATARSAVERAARLRQGGLRSIRFFPEYAAEWPLWDDASDDDLCRETLDLSQDLWNEIRSWNEEWASQFDHDSGWLTALRRDAWFSTGDALTKLLHEELWELAVVTPRFRVYREV